MRLSICIMLAVLAGSSFAEASMSDGSYSIKSSISSLEGDTRYLISVSEHYSAVQKRAKLDYSVQTRFSTGGKKQERSGTIYFDLERDYMLNYDDLQKSCSPTSIDELYRKILRMETPAKEAGVAAEYIIGPSRLLHFIQLHRVEGNLNPVYSFGGRNHDEAAAFSFVHKELLKDGYKFTIYYDKSPFEEKSTTALEIFVESTDNRRMFFNFFGSDFTDSDSSPETLKVVRQGMTTFDQFALDPMTGCTEALSKSAQYPFAKLADSLGRFSFSARLNPIHNDGSLSMFVAYDTRLNSLRVDSFDSGYRFSKLIDIKQNRLYHSITEHSIGGQQATQELIDLNKPCVVARLFPEAADQEAHLKLGTILGGSESFVYLGKAQVRGINSVAYAKFGESIPFFVEEFITYKNAKKELMEIRVPGSRIRTSEGTSQTLTVVYFADSADESTHLVNIEIMEIHSKTNGLLNWRAVQIFDFSWDLDYESFNEIEADELFSIGHVCSNKLEEFGTVEMHLESDGAVPEVASGDNAVSNRKKRHLDLLKGLQDSLKLPSSLVQDVNSRLMPSKIHTGGKELAVTFRVAERIKDLAELVYLGLGRYDSCNDRKTSYANSFTDCFTAVAHRGQNLTFSYEAMSRFCSVCVDVTDKVSSKEPTGYAIVDSGAYEIYQVRHIEERSVDKGKLWLNHAILTKDYVKFLNKKFTFSVGNSSADFKLSKLHIERLDHHQSSQDEGQLVRRIPGFGIVVVEGGGQRVSPVQQVHWGTQNQQAGYKPGIMSFEQCEASCLFDSNCFSFSVCVQASEVHCVKSTASFADPQVAKQVTHDKIESVSQGSKVSVVLNNGQSVELIKHRFCDLYNKKFLDLFKKTAPISHSLTNMQVKAVRSREECAMICYLKTISVLKNDVGEASEVVPYFGSILTNSEESLSQLQDEIRKAAKKVCRQFMYLAKLDASFLPDMMRNRVNELADLKEDDDSEFEGYCVNDNQAPLSKSTLGQSETFSLERFNMKFETFYEKKMGVYLQSSALSKTEEDAYNAVTRIAGKADLSAYKTLKPLVDRGENFQESVRGHESKCALVCFQQFWGPWPACRSFDLLMFSDGTTSSYFCRLNSISLTDAINTKRFDLVKSDEKIHVWHYEPRAGFMAGESELYELFDLKDSFSIPTWRVRSPFVLFLVVLVGLVSGLLSGINLAPLVKTKISQYQKSRDSRGGLITVDTIEFENRVDQDGRIL